MYKARTKRYVPSTAAGSGTVTYSATSAGIAPASGRKGTR